MKILGIIFSIVLGLAALIFIITYLCFIITFYSPSFLKKSDCFEIPPGKIYKPYKDVMIGWMKNMRSLPYRKFETISFDGLKLAGKYYEYKPGAPIEIMFHGYRGAAERDLSGGIVRCFELERNCLIVDQRASGESEGHIISFGINERRDCLSWIELVIKEFGPDVKIILTGISMGAATVMMAAGMDLPDNVVGILADCGYTSPKAIIQKVIKQLHFPVKLMYPFVKAGAKLFAKIDIEEASPIEAMKICKKPIIFVHGEDDNFVPCYMCKENYDACAAPKYMITVPGAGHGLSYMVDTDKYMSGVREGSKLYYI